MTYSYVFALKGDLPCINDINKQPAQAVFSYGPDELVDPLWLPWSLNLGSPSVHNPKGNAVFYRYILQLTLRIGDMSHLLHFIVGWYCHE